MAKRNLRAPIAAFALLALATTVLAQDRISEDEAKAVARRVARVLGGSAKFGADAQVNYERAEGRLGGFVVRVTEPGTAITTDAKGVLLSYSHTARIADPYRVGARRYADDEANWSALEAKLAALDLPMKFKRVKFKRVKGNANRPDALRFSLDMLPHGYRASTKAEASAWMASATGEVFALNLIAGWDFEPPNIQASPEEAVAKAVEIYGGKPAEWKFELTYEADGSQDAPSGIRNLTERRVKRLCYNLFHPNGSVLVDTVTGEVVAYGSPISQAADPRKLGRLGAPELLAGAGVLVLVAGGVLLSILRRRRL